MTTHLLRYVNGICQLLCLTCLVITQAQANESFLEQIIEPPSSGSNRGWQMRDSAESAAYLARAIADGAVPEEQSDAAKDHLRATIEILTARCESGAWWYPGTTLQGDPNLNRFVLTALLDALWTIRDDVKFSADHPRWLARLRPAMALQKEAYRGGIKWDWGANTEFRYPNQDALYALAFALAAKLFSEAAYAGEAEKAIQSLVRNQMQGGGWHYIAGESEVPIYHALVQAVLVRYLDVVDDVRVREMLRRSTEYWRVVLSSRGVAEGWSDVWWKQNWIPIPSAIVHISAIAGDDFILAAVAQTMKERERSQPPRISWAQAYTWSWRRLTIPPAKAGPDQYLTIDADQRGAHGRNGDWYFGVTKGRGLRNTFVGAMLESDGLSPLASTFRGAQIIVTDTNSASNEYALSQQTDQVVMSLKSRRAVLSAQYLLQPKRINGVPSPKDLDSPWEVRQLWSAGRDGLIGTIELKAAKHNAASAVIGRLPLGPCPVKADGPSTWSCGGMRIRVFEGWGSPKVVPLGAAYPSQVDRWDGIEWMHEVQGVKVGGIYRYGVWVGPAEASPPGSLVVVPGGWDAHWDDGRALEVRLNGSDLTAVESGGWQ